ncbi:MAG TPA: HAD family hydrolase [Gemmataceae bacterium]|nr:HAD family hydrolase [Gemmataceae bacterium]
MAQPLPAGTLELLRPTLPRGRFRAALFDFDGTLSLLREGWPRVMTALMREAAERAGVRAPLDNIIESIVVGLNGKPTIVQMTRFAEEMAALGGRPGTPADYAAEYQIRLLGMIRERYDAIRSGRATAGDWSVPGGEALLGSLRDRGVLLILASGTEVTHVRREADLLGLTSYFSEHLYAPVGDDANFSKRAVVERLLRDHGLRGVELLGFGDGVVETEEVRRAGGVAVAVASAEPPDRGVNAWKRDRLVRAGADIVIPDFAEHERWLPWLFGER